MSTAIGFDRLIELDWLDLIASRYAAARDARTAFYETRSVVALTTGGGDSHHNATGKTMTVLARIWLRVSEGQVGLRDRAASLLPSLGPDDRMAIHWAMCELAYPFYLDAASVAGKAIFARDEITQATLRARLTERWGARGTMPPAAQRLLQTWARWGVVAPTEERGRYVGGAPRHVGPRAWWLRLEFMPTIGRRWTWMSFNVRPISSRSCCQT